VNKSYPLEGYGAPRSTLSDSEIVLRAISAAPGALTWVQQARKTRVLHVFKTSCNLIDAQGELLSLILVPAQMDPFAISCTRIDGWPGFTGYLDGDSPVRIMPAEIRVGKLRISIEDPVTWNSLPAWRAIRTGLSRSTGWIRQIEARLKQHRSADSLAALISRENAARHGAQSPWWTKATAPVDTLLEGLTSRDEHKLAQGAASLSGLGPGLTPSGDDFLVGLMYAIWSMLKSSEVKTLCGVLEKAAAPRTGLFSAAHIRAAARGEAAAYWHGLLTACVEGDPKEIDAALDTLLAVGHTSGEDAVSGFVLGTLRLASPVD